jgi:branched-chain amino acid transport system ATP-binding protein
MEGGEMAEPLLNIQGLHSNIGQYHILHGVDLQVPKGSLTVLLGRNGAGKSTTLRTIMGLCQITGGSVSFKGEDIGRLRTPFVARKGIAFVPEHMGIFSLLSVHENMELAAIGGPMDEQRLGWIFELFPALKKFWHSPAGNLSGGQKQMLAVARAIIEPRELLLIDEPTKGLAPAIINHMQAAFRQLKEMQTTILLVEQNFNFAKSLGDTVAVMDSGRIVHAGNMAELAGDPALQARLLGLSLDQHQ